MLKKSIFVLDWLLLLWYTRNTEWERTRKSQDQNDRLPIGGLFLWKIDMNHKQRQAVREFDSELQNIITQSLNATSNLNVAGMKTVQGLLAVLHDQATKGSKYPEGAEKDIRDFVAEVKAAIAENASKHIALIESLTVENYAQVARDNNISI